MDVLAHLTKSIEQSELAAAARRLRNDGAVEWAVGPNLRQLNREEIASLEQLGNQAADWACVRVHGDFQPHRVRGCQFHGNVVLGRFDQHLQVAGIPIAPGISDCLLSEVVIGNDAWLRRVQASNYVIGPRAALFDCGVVKFDGGAAMGCGTPIRLGIETGGREVAVYAEIDLETITALVRNRDDTELQASYSSTLENYLNLIRMETGIIGAEARLHGVGHLSNSYIGAGCQIEAACWISDSTLLSEPTQPTRIQSGAVIRDCVVQWGSRIADHAVCANSVFAENSGADKQSCIAHSYVGPCTEISLAEVTSALIGPLVGFHHQALLIAAVWPAGRGNVAYGANLGSNHTGKAPDQELWAGEGTFFGLGCNVKYPTNLDQSPYSVIASGVNLLPQRIRFPFSLVNSPTATHLDFPPAFNELFPAWQLSDNLFSIRRSERKFAERFNCARSELDPQIIRADIVELMVDAYQRLKSCTGKQHYLETDIAGLGKNYLREPVRLRAIEAYRFHIEKHALERCWTELSGAKPADRQGILERLRNNRCWGRFLPDPLDLAQVAARLCDHIEQEIQSVEASKAKDDARGERIIPDYRSTHHPAADHPFVKWFRENSLRRIEAIRDFAKS